jgi:putative cofactor-binding repeat protein
MIRRPHAPLLAVTFVVAVVLGACGATPTGPALTDPKAIVTAALTSTEAAKSVHLALTANGEATVALPIGGGTGTPLDLTGTTASADIDFMKPAAHATFALNAGVTINGEAIAVDGKTYLKTGLTGPLYVESAAGAGLFDASILGNLIDNLGDILLKPGVNLVKGDDVACGSKQCYTVSAQLSADDLGATALTGLPVNLQGATVKVTARVEKDLPYHLAGVTAVLSQADGAELTVDVTASKWDEPVTISAPPADQVKPAS